VSTKCSTQSFERRQTKVSRLHAASQQLHSPYSSQFREKVTTTKIPNKGYSETSNNTKQQHNNDRTGYWLVVTSALEKNWLLGYSLFVVDNSDA